ncbi:MAG: guanylate kinase [Bdellovibrionales bacterium RIFCSPHIGHO2_01_FULL_40_29]|nr:MAG: guanylate kinase [Bdellovibrionales bacterium RIFCSPHIGHO2_01_FULL_40_29]OFZ34551.1 MAG: guanylate kinase [Bdellovibrionales bacterium RIFCSPHIGHO2_02_FULL_40_15]
MKTRMIIVAAPSGAGKSSFVERIASEDPRLHDIITYTTRPMRHHESEGKPYFFTSNEDFQKKIKDEFFIEWAQVHTNFYGTSYEQIRLAWAKDKVVIMDIDIQGVETFKSKFPDAKTVFILPPSIEELKRRVIKRDGAPPADLDIRMKNAEKEMAKASEFDVQIINDDFNRSYAEFKKIVENWIT